MKQNISLILAISIAVVISFQNCAQPTQISLSEIPSIGPIAVVLSPPTTTLPSNIFPPTITPELKKERWKVAVSADGSYFLHNGILRAAGLESSLGIGRSGNAAVKTFAEVKNGIQYKTIDSGYDKVCATDINDTAYCWGYQVYGYLGRPFAPVNVINPIVFDPTLKFQAAGAAFYHSCGLTVAGVWRCWGADGFSHRIVDFVGGKVNFNTMDKIDTYSTISTGQDISCAISTAGILRCTGTNYAGEMGIAWPSVELSGTVKPRDVDFPTTYESISAGIGYSSAAYEFNMCAITTEGLLKCWGQNAFGQLGIGNKVNQNTPVPVDAGERYFHVSAGGSQACAITTSGVLKCWGRNHMGQLGIGNLIDQSLPVVVDPGVDYKSVATITGTGGKGSHTCALTADNKVKCWGSNGQGQLGDGTTTNRNLPVFAILE